MSSRSFRRRNNRRRHRPGEGGEPGALKPGQPRPAGQPEQPQDRGRRGQQERGQPDAQGDRRRGGQQRRDRQPGRGGRGPGGRAPEPVLQKPEVPLVFPDCPICGKQVRELSSALTHKITQQPAHFDCVFRELREANPLSPQEKLCYLGGGCFGILEFRPTGGPAGFVIKRRIQYEEKDPPQLWKKPLQISC
jgi:hypothetical protein